MAQGDDRVAAYEARLVDLWDRMVRAVGIHTVNLLMERAIWEASQKHPQLALIQVGDDGLKFDELNKSFASRSNGEVARAFDDLTSELLLILARLLGREMAQRFGEELKVRMDRERQEGRGKKAAT